MPAALSEIDATIVKGMLLRGDRQHDIASWFGVNAGRVAEVKTGAKHRDVIAAPMHALPPPGPYSYFTDAKNGGPALSTQESLERILATFDLKWSRELATAAHERRQTNEKIDILLRKVTALERERGLVEKPAAPRVSRRKPLGG
jgi:hypothetical protein